MSRPIVIGRKLAKYVREGFRSLKSAHSNSSSARESFHLLWLLQMVRPYTMVAPARLGTLYSLCKEIDRRGIAGDIVECGTCNGGSAAVLGYATQDSHEPRALWLFDSFEGLPMPTEKDGIKAQGCQGTCAGTEENVREILKKLRVADTRVHIAKGWFEDTLSTAPVGRISLLHIDADWYESVGQCLNEFYDRVEPGGFIVLDDYGCWEGCRRAFDGFVSERRLSLALVRVDDTGHYFEKPVVKELALAYQSSEMRVGHA